MTTNKTKIAAWIRNERGEHARGPATFDPLCIFGSPEPQGLVASYSPVVMLTDYEALQAECDALRSNTRLSLGVGDGDGNLFVHGDYDSIKRVQALIFENERLLKDVEALSDALQGLLNIVSDSSGVVGYHLNGNIADWDEFEEVENAELVLYTYNKQGGES